MLVKLTQDVTTQYHKTAKGGYSSAEINYDGAKRPFKLVSFKNPAVFDVFKGAKAGQAFEVDSEKEGDFYTWKAAKPVSADEVKAAAPKATYTPGPDPRETKEERALRQRLIVRQSSLANAVEVLGPHKEGEDFQGYLDLAQRFAEWVYEDPDLFDEPNDIPF